MATTTRLPKPQATPGPRREAKATRTLAVGPTTTWGPGRIAGVTAVVSVVLCIIGAVLFQTSGADLWLAMDASTPSEMASQLSDVAAAKTQMVVALSVWLVAFPLLATAGVLLARLGSPGAVSAFSKAVFASAIGAMVVFLSMMMTFVVAIAPAHAAGEDVLTLARTVGFATSTIDWVMSALVMGFAPVAAVFAGRNRWAPTWLQRFAVVTLVVTFVEIFALAIDERGLAFVIVPFGLAHIAAAGIAAFRHAD